jgi:pimeloyl-ACP methyl ester carboxylesterase
MTVDLKDKSGPTLNLARCRGLCESVYRPRDAHATYVTPYDHADGHRRRFYCDAQGSDIQVVCQESIHHGIEIVVRGTISIWDVPTNVKCWQTKMPTCNRPDFGSVHYGFLTAALDVIKPIRSWLTSAPIPNNTPVVITGHSMGGAIATILAPMISDLTGNCVVVTFGSPRVGDGAFKEAFHATAGIHHIRVINDNDPIAYVPMIGYHHVGHALVMPQLEPQKEEEEDEDGGNKNNNATANNTTTTTTTWYMTQYAHYAQYVAQSWRHIRQITVYLPTTMAHTLHEYKLRMKLLPPGQLGN